MAWERTRWATPSARGGRAAERPTHLQLGRRGGRWVDQDRFTFVVFAQYIRSHFGDFTRAQDGTPRRHALHQNTLCNYIEDVRGFSTVNPRGVRQIGSDRRGILAFPAHADQMAGGTV